MKYYWVGLGLSFHFTDTLFLLCCFCGVLMLIALFSVAVPLGRLVIVDYTH